mgnify:CR=1 FL=1
MAGGRTGRGVTWLASMAMMAAVTVGVLAAVPRGLEERGAGPAGPGRRTASPAVGDAAAQVPTLARRYGAVRVQLGGCGELRRGQTVSVHLEGLAGHVDALCQVEEGDVLCRGVPAGWWWLDVAVGDGFRRVGCQVAEDEVTVVEWPCERE